MIDYKRILFKHAGRKFRYGLYEKISLQMTYGVPLKEALRELAQRSVKRKDFIMEDIINNISNNVKNGKSFAESIKKWIPQQDYAMFISAEKSGKLPEVLIKAVEIDKMKVDIRRNLISAFTNPAILFAITYFLLYYMGVKALPPILKIIHGKVSGFTNILLYLVDFTHSTWLFIVPVLAVIAITAFFISLPIWTGKIRKYADNLFPYSIYREYSGFLWLINFSNMLYAGITQVAALKDISRYSSKYIAERSRDYYRRMIDGENLGKAMNETGYNFPNPDLVDDLFVLSKFPDFDKRLAKIAEDNIAIFKRRMDSIAKSLSAFANTFMYILIVIIFSGVASLVLNVATSLNKY